MLGREQARVLVETRKNKAENNPEYLSSAASKKRKQV